MIFLPSIFGRYDMTIPISMLTYFAIVLVIDSGAATPATLAKKTTKTDDEKANAGAGFVILLFLLWCFCGDHGDRRRYNAYYD